MFRIDQSVIKHIKKAKTITYAQQAYVEEYLGRMDEKASPKLYKEVKALLKKPVEPDLINGKNMTIPDPIISFVERFNISERVNLQELLKSADKRGLSAREREIINHIYD